MWRAWWAWILVAAGGVALAADAVPGVAADPTTGIGLGLGGVSMAAALGSLAQAVKGLQTSGLRHRHSVTIRVDRASLRALARLRTDEVTLEDDERERTEERPRPR